MATIEIICSICLDDLTEDNKMLPCQHTYHRKCLLNYVGRSKTIVCPDCREKHSVRVDDLKPNFLVNQILAVLAVIREKLSGPNTEDVIRELLEAFDAQQKTSSSPSKSPQTGATSSSIQSRAELERLRRIEANAEAWAIWESLDANTGPSTANEPDSCIAPIAAPTKGVSRPEQRTPTVSVPRANQIALTFVEFEETIDNQSSRVGRCFCRFKQTISSERFNQLHKNPEFQGLMWNVSLDELRQFGRALKDRGELQKSMFIYNTAYEESLRRKDAVSLVYSIIGISYAILRLKRSPHLLAVTKQFHGTALEAVNFLSSLPIQLEEMIDSKAYCFYNLGLVYKVQGQLESALQNFDEAIILINSYILKPEKSFIYKKLIENKRTALYGLGRTEEARALKTPVSCIIL